MPPSILPRQSAKIKVLFARLGQVAGEYTAVPCEVSGQERANCGRPPSQDFTPIGRQGPHAPRLLAHGRSRRIPGLTLAYTLSPQGQKEPQICGSYARRPTAICVRNV